jgi:hypothetical protein
MPLMAKYKNSHLPHISEEARIVFTEEMYGIVSDHAGIYARFSRRIDASARE